MSVRFWVGVVAGVAGGYAVGRILEAKAQGVPLRVAFAQLGVSVASLRQGAGPASDTVERGAKRVRKVVAEQPMQGQHGDQDDDEEEDPLADVSLDAVFENA